MSAPNFHRVNAANYYVLDGRSYWKDGEQIDAWEDGCEVEDGTRDEIETIRENAGAYNKKGWAGYYGAWHVPSQDWKSEGYGNGHTIVCKKIELLELTPDCSIEIRTEIHYRPGYYEAGTLDWAIFANDENGNSFSGEYAPEDVDGLVLDALDYIGWRESHWNAGIIKMQAKNIARKIEAAIERAQDGAEEFCRQHCTGVYGLAYLFSNGEAGYIKIS